MAFRHGRRDGLIDLRASAPMSTSTVPARMAIPAETRLSRGRASDARLPLLSEAAVQAEPSALPLLPRSDRAKAAIIVLGALSLLLQSQASPHDRGPGRTVHRQPKSARRARVAAAGWAPVVGATRSMRLGTRRTVDRTGVPAAMIDGFMPGARRTRCSHGWPRTSATARATRSSRLARRRETAPLCIRTRRITVERSGLRLSPTKEGPSCAPVSARA